MLDREESVVPNSGMSSCSTAIHRICMQQRHEQFFLVPCFEFKIICIWDLCSISLQSVREKT